MNETAFWIIAMFIFLAVAGWFIGLWSFLKILYFTYKIIEFPIRLILLAIGVIITITHNWGKTKRELEIEEALDELLGIKIMDATARNPEYTKELALTGKCNIPPVTLTKADVYNIMTKEERVQLARETGIRINDLEESNNGK